MAEDFADVEELEDTVPYKRCGEIHALARQAGRPEQATGETKRWTDVSWTMEAEDQMESDVLPGPLETGWA